MSFYIESSVGHVDRVGMTWVRSSPEGPVGKDLRSRGRKLALLAAASVHKKTGRLARSINSKYVIAMNPSVLVGSDVRYAYDVHEGTPPHLIIPNRGRYLRFKQNGKVVYAREVHHPGTRATKFLTRHLRKVI